MPTFYKATIVATGEYYEGDAQGLIQLLLDEGHAEYSAKQLVRALKNRRVLVIPGMIIGSAHAHAPEAPDAPTP